MCVKLTVTNVLITFAPIVKLGGHNWKLTSTHKNNNWLYNFYLNRVVSHWNSLPADIVHGESLLIFAAKLNSVDIESFAKWVEPMGGSLNVLVCRNPSPRIIQSSDLLTLIKFYFVFYFVWFNPAYYWLVHYITLSAFQTPPTPKVTSGASTITCYTKYSPPTTQASYTQQVGNDQKGKSAVQRRRSQQRRLQQHSQYHFLDGATWV